MKASTRLLQTARHFTKSHSQRVRLPGFPVTADDPVTSLASKPLHSFSLADLVRYSSSNFARAIQVLQRPFLSLTNPGSGTVVLHCPPMHSSPPPTSPSLSFPSASRTAFKLCATSPTSSCQIPTSRASTPTTSTHSPHSSLTPTRTSPPLPTK